MLQYALLHLFGYALSMDDLKQFRVCEFALYEIGLC
jgi:transketolase